MHEELFTPAAAGAFLGGDQPISTTTLAEWRVRGVGPAYIKVGRLIRYQRTDLLSWLASRRRDDLKAVPQ